MKGFFLFLYVRWIGPLILWESLRTIRHVLCCSQHSLLSGKIKVSKQHDIYIGPSKGAGGRIRGAHWGAHYPLTCWSKPTPLEQSDTVFTLIYLCGAVAPELLMGFLRKLFFTPMKPSGLLPGRAIEKKTLDCKQSEKL